jgi:ATP/maltotriose-dependent transcriptional regulator MalT
MLSHLDRLPAPQRDALATAFGRSAGAAPGRFLVGLATLTLFAEVAEQRPLACVVDDAQWLDGASAQILGFVARRLLAERIAVVCAARTGAGDDVLAGLPVLPVPPLADSDARALLLANVPGPLDARVCDQIVTESHGNPLALLELPLHLSALGLASAWMGDFAGAASNIAEADSVAAATGSHFAPYTLLRLRALQGREAEASAAIEHAAAAGPGVALYAQWAAAVLHNGLARYQEAAWAARQATSNTFEYWVSVWALPELVEAAMHVGDAEPAREALERLAETTQPAGTDVALGIEARSRALLSDGTAANDLYREAIERFSRTRLRPELARAHLLYGEWLRREGRRVDAREQLRTAHHLFDEIGMEAFAERARRELLATGEKARKRSPGTRGGLTPQEEQIARLARDGLSNPEIGAQLFVSARTVEWHLRNVFTKLGITSRRQLQTALPEDGRRASTRT